ncbi:HPr family phosphocarrier protein [Desulfocurvibacter africanus]|uniref:Phosphocarrier protein HPr n=1 Tax=Desulfocurvibacter africanus subsp. africanus str. Walvis Bay TaxID=690850 RepID=F3Z138_DESAF|nr:HPr family phosphocarrier protein [Desulfocurvibacter africanus]EGJ49936.1 Phosphotransferase system, phosphocarrier protein HPr [Desulfocurvibacter africanus subsp. africanus str. Walvis Bay]
MDTQTNVSETQRQYLTRRVCVVNELGLHARPAARLAQEAQKFSSRILLKAGAQEVDAKSILDILTLAARNGCGLEIMASGEDAAQAVEHLARLFRTKFQEG